MADWLFEFTDEAKDDLEKLEHITRRRVLGKIRWLSAHFEIIVPLPLGGPWRGFFKLRIGDWRVVYEAEDNTRKVTIHLIDRRDKIYKRNIPQR